MSGVLADHSDDKRVTFRPEPRGHFSGGLDTSISKPRPSAPRNGTHVWPVRDRLWRHASPPSHRAAAPGRCWDNSSPAPADAAGRPRPRCDFSLLFSGLSVGHRRARSLLMLHVLLDAFHGALRLGEGQPVGARSASTRYDSFLLMRLACALAMRTSSLVCSKRSAKSPTCLASFFRSRLLGIISRGRRTPRTRGRRARLIAARAASPSAAVPASAPSAPFAIVARPSTDCAGVRSAVAVDPPCRRRAEALGERRLAGELDPERLRAELDAFVVVAAPALFARELDPERFRAELDALLVVAAPALLELCLPGERDELPLGLFGVATEPPWSGVRQLASQGTARVNRSTKAGRVLRLGPTRVTIGTRSGADRRAAHPVPGRNGHPAGGQHPPSRRQVCGLPRSNLVPQLAIRSLPPQPARLLYGRSFRSAALQPPPPARATAHPGRATAPSRYG